MKELIPFQIETQRVLQLLAKQIYQSPLALLRENTQNAFDAIRLRIHNNENFDPRIDVQLDVNKIIISDNGLGMTPEDLRLHYWTAGSSSKNNATARAAGVVGTFGIGAMANFGIADFLTVETESAITSQRTICRADRLKLSLTENCIESETLSPSGEPGTIITANIENGNSLNVAQAKKYISEFVSLVDVPVYINGELVSQKPIESLVPLISQTWQAQGVAQKIGARLIADYQIIISNNADIWIKLTNLNWSTKNLSGSIVLRSGQSTLRTFRSGFGLATASVNSFYQLGGVVDLMILEPTAGREAITVEGLQLLQSIISEVDAFISHQIADIDESDSSTPFMNWIVAHSRYDLCQKMKMTIIPGDRIVLREIAVRSSTLNMLLYEGADQAVIKMHASEESPLLVLARNNPRRTCEQHFLKTCKNIKIISDTPVVKNRRSSNNFRLEESALAFRIESILDSDYFLKAAVVYGEISHGLPILVENKSGNISIILNPEGQTIKLILGLYQTEFTAFGSMTKDFVRTIIFPRIAEYVPSSTRQGAEAFLKAIKRPRELFEYADDDLGDLPKIWEDYNVGLISLDQAVQRSSSAARSSIQVVETTTRVADVVPDVIQNEHALQSNIQGHEVNLEALPAITRLEKATSAKLLVIDEKDPAFRGYRSFLALTDKARESMGEFFLQPHRTSVVWGGQKTLFIFIHHSGQFGLYYDLQTSEAVTAPAGGGSYMTSTIVLKDKIFIPIPNEISASFIPDIGERKRFEVRADILRTES